MTATSTIPGFIDALIEKVESITWPVLLNSAEPVVVSDAWPSSSEPENLVVIASDPDGAPIEVEQTFRGVSGGVRSNENYSVPCFISCVVGGSSDGGTVPLSDSDAQYAARQNAFRIYQSIQSALQADLRLQNVANPPPAGVLWCQMSTRAAPKHSGPEDNGQWRRVDIPFTVYVRAIL